MKIKMKTYIQKVMVMVTLMVGLCMAGLAVELPTKEIKAAASRGLEIYLRAGKLSMEQTPNNAVSRSS